MAMFEVTTKELKFYRGKSHSLDVSNCTIDEMANYVTLLVVKIFSRTSKTIKKNDVTFRRLCYPM